jgi:hypothetical protein
MAWTASIQNKYLDANGSPRIEVLFTNGVTGAKASQIISGGDLNSVKNAVNNVVASLTNSENLVTSLTTGAFDSTVTVVPDTQAQIDEKAWLVDYRQLVKAYETLVVPKIIPETNPVYAALMAKVQAGLKASYLNDI